MKQAEILYKKRKKLLEEKLGRPLTSDEEIELDSDILTEFILKIKIPDEEISDLEIDGTKE